MARWAHRLVVFLVCSVFACTCSYAQFSGNIQGIVMDSSGSAIAEARVDLRNVDTGVTSSTTTGATGNYSFSALPPGNYAVSASKTGFKTSEVNLTLSTAELQGINITLQVASVSANVKVVAEAATLDTAETRLEATLFSQTVRDLPELNRNLWDVLAVMPGVVGTGTRGAGESPGGGSDNFGTQTPQISANGRSYTGNIVYVDGMNVTSPIQNGNIILAPIPDAVQEVTMQANSWDAENALGSSVVVQVTTKSGTNQFHGTGSLFYTNQDLQAAPDFSAVSPFSRKDLVGALGGPIRRNKTFFFADVEKLWSTAPESTGKVNFEDPAFVSWAQANFPNTVGTSLFTLYPASNLKANGGTTTALQYFNPTGGCPSSGNITIPGSSGATIPCATNVFDSGSFEFSPYYNALQYNFRFDQYFTPNDRLYVSYYNDSFDQQAPSPRAGLGAANIMRNRYGQIDYTHTFSPNLLLEGAFAFASVGGANGQNADLKVPVINISDGAQGFIVGSGFGPGEYRGPNYNWRVVLSWVHGPHTFKFGYDGDRGIEHGDFTPDNVIPNFTFNSIFDLVQDNPYSETVGAYNPLTGTPGTVRFGGQENPFGFFAQDNWKVKSNLTLTLGLRWDDFTNHTPWGNSGFQFSSLYLGSGNTLQEQVANASVMSDGNGGVFANAQTNYWSPRIGFAWDPTKTGSWSVRGGVGVYRDWVVMGQSVDQMRNNPPGVVSPTFITGVTAVQPVFALAPSGTYPFNFPLPNIPAEMFDSKGGNTTLQPAVDSLARNLTAPFAVNYVIGFEHQLPWTLVVGANYSGSRSYDGLTGTDQNRCAGCTAAARPNTSFGSIDYVGNANSGTYNAMILTVRGRPSSAFSFQASYTLSHAMDYPEAGTRFDQDGGLNIPDPTAYFTYWSDANWDVRNRFSLSEVYTLPGMKSGFGKVLTSGWEVSSITAIQSGTPFWVYCGSAACDYNQDGVNYDIPNAPATDFSGSHSRQSYISGLFTAADFPAPAPGTEGSLKRNSYRNPGLFQVDASVLKNTRVPWFGEAGSLQLRFDFVNLFNHVNLGPVDANLADGNFGRVTSALSARQLQLGARISF
ncbi:MAG TPA: TonB-dependent receptor [Candidatus Acidoferrales bacterium]|nr:TonB-dependent receptor [Candidatus Acidoferrales bacterium]